MAPLVTPLQLHQTQKPLEHRAGHGVIALTLVALVALTTAGSPGWADGARGPVEAFSVPLRCQVDGGAWRDCQMVVEQVGTLWQLVLGGERYGFQHDGRGLVRMRRGEGEWTPVQARWSADASLCWNGLCARGDIPLD